MTYYDSRTAAPRGSETADEGSPLLGKDETPVPTLTVSPEESVYSAILFLPAISRLTTGTETNRPARLAVFLCIVNALLQMGMVQVINIYDHNNRAGHSRALMQMSDIVSSDSQGSPMVEAHINAENERRDEFHRSFLPPREKAELDSTKEIIPLCQRIGDGHGTFNCMPNSVKFLYEWKDLDIDGDGVWTIHEARWDRNHLKNKLLVSPETMFENMLNGLHMNAHYWNDMGGNQTTFYLSQDVRSRRAIPKAYFNYWMGDAMMCSLFDPNSCEAAAKQGVFKEALHPGRVSAGAKGIHDLDSAIQYCYRMLQPGGGCETLLPTDFKRNREQRWGRCGAPSLVEAGKYTNPYDVTQSVHVLATSYGRVNAYKRATSRMYLFFLVLIVTLWLLSLIDEVRELIKLGEFLVFYPGIDANETHEIGTHSKKNGEDLAFVRVGGTVIPANPELGTDTVYKITGISKRHRVVLLVVWFSRFCVCNILAQFGTRFLLVETNYLDLVLNSLALTFILTIDAMLYALVEKDVTQELMSAASFEFETRLPTQGIKGYMLKKECWGLFLVPALSVCLVLIHNYRNKEPVLVALRCACLQEGQKCQDSVASQTAWWADYWGKVLPAATHQIEALRFSGM